MSENNNNSIFDWLGPVGGLAEGIFNIFSQGRQNRKNRQFQLQMWNRQNAYNHPVKQMERLREANLSPHLVYGGGAATHTATNANTPNQQAPQANVDILGRIIQAQQLQNLGKQEQLLEKQTEKTIKEAQNISARTTGQKIGNALSAGTLGSNVSYAKSKAIEKQQKAVQGILFNSKLPQLLQTQINERIARTLKANADKTLAETKNAIEQEILNMREAGLNPNDSYIEKLKGQVLEQILDYFGINPRKVKIESKFKN